MIFSSRSPNTYVSADFALSTRMIHDMCTYSVLVHVLIVFMYMYMYKYM